jgi:hypothetical protein
MTGMKTDWKGRVPSWQPTAQALMSERQENWLQRLNGEAITLLMAVGGFVLLLIGIAVMLILLKQERTMNRQAVRVTGNRTAYMHYP